MNPKLLMQQHDRKWLAERVCELEAEADATDRAYIDECATNVYLEADNAALQKQVEGLREALLEAKVTLESIDDNHPQTEYALKKVEKALQGAE